MCIRDSWSEVWSLTIDTQGPEAPSPIAPIGTITTETPTFIWHKVADAVKYRVTCVTGKVVVFDTVTVDTTYIHSTPFTEGEYRWQVKAKDLANNWGAFSDPMGFTVALGTPGWAQLESMPTQISGKYVKDGGALTSANVDKGMVLFAFRGNKSNEFYRYTPGNPGVWALMESIKFTYKPGSTTINKKKVGKGAALCWDGENTIYATKGNGTFEFWAYDISGNAWTRKAYIPSGKAPKGGTALIFKDGKVYLLAGGQKADASTNFFEFTPDADTGAWTQKPKAPLEPDNKVYKDGSCLAKIGSTIYALKGGGAHNYLYKFDGTSWTYSISETIPLLHPQTGNKKIKVKDGGAMTSDGSVLYAIKGGGSHQFWKYTPGEPGTWTGLD
ncbi:MAG: hypothetical protein N2748_06100, partial [candidate division WOR-3 bacterium]|nr:hypothetical protein [candidate division WOR-3 bacterium]